MPKVIAEQANLYVSDTIITPYGTSEQEHHRYNPSTGEDNRISSFKYNDTMTVVVSGGSGSGSLHYDLENITGEATLSSSGKLTFKQPGTVWVKCYRSGSPFYHYPDTGNPVDGYYQSSKNLVFEVTLQQQIITIKVIPESGRSLPIGSIIPKSPVDLTYVPITEGLIGSDTLSVQPTLYFVYNSDDFYRFDVMTRVFAEDRYENGVSFKMNNDGSRTVRGTATEDAYYNLISSPTRFPSYIDPLKTYRLYMHGGTVELWCKWFMKDGTDESERLGYNGGQILDQDIKFGVHNNKEASGIQLYLFVPSGTTLNRTVTYNIIDLEDRSMTTRKESSYPVSARGAKVPNKSGYDPVIRYRSSRLNIVNVQNYSIITRVLSSDSSINNINSAKMGTLTSSRNYAKAYDEVILIATSLKGALISDEDNITYQIDHSHPRTDYDVFYEEGTTVSLGSITAFYISDGSGYNNVPFIVVSREEDYAHRNVRGTYRLIMPACNVVVCCKFKYVQESYIPFGPDPYDDVGPVGSGKRIILEDKDYWDALMFCYYARQSYFSEYNQEPLMQGSGGRLFYREVNQLVGPKRPEHTLLRRELAVVTSRLSHSIKASAPSSEFPPATYPTSYFMNWTFNKNMPEAFMYTYAGYVPKFIEDGENIVPMTDVNYMFPDGLIPSVSLENNAANDDFLGNTNFGMPEVAWTSWIGVTNGYNAYSFAPNSSVTFEEAATVLWRYAAFRQIKMQGGANTSIDDSSAASWAKNGPIRWAVQNELLKPINMYYIEDGVRKGGGEVTPKQYIDRAQFAYMVMRFCMLYSW